MTTIIIGAGAIGLLVAGQLARAGQPVAVLARPGSAAALSQRGITLRRREQSERVGAVRFIGDPAEYGPGAPDLAILCVKGYDTDGALPALEALGAATILTLQNGIGNEERLAAHFGPNRILSGAITTSVEVGAPGEISVTKTGGIGLAPVSPAGDTARAARLLRAAGFTVRSFADHRSLKWSKALLNMFGNATAAILDLPVATIYADDRLIALERQMAAEVLAVMARRGIRPVNLPRYPAALLALALRVAPPALINPVLRQVVAGGRGGKAPSLLLDLARGNRRSEGALLYGAVAQAAAESSMDAPVNRKLWETLRTIADGTQPWSNYRHQPERLLEAVGQPDRTEARP